MYLWIHSYEFTWSPLYSIVKWRCVVRYILCLWGRNPLSSKWPTNPLIGISSIKYKNSYRVYSTFMTIIEINWSGNMERIIQIHNDSKFKWVYLQLLIWTGRHGLLLRPTSHPNLKWPIRQEYRLGMFLLQIKNVLPWSQKTFMFIQSELWVTQLNKHIAWIIQHMGNPLVNYQYSSVYQQN